METVHTCPLGSVCEEAKDGKIYRCRWLLEISKADSQGQKIPGSEYDECAIPMQSIHMTDLKKGNIGLQQAIESFRNEMMADNDRMLKIQQGRNNASLPRQ